MRRLLLTALLLGCHRDLDVPPCSHDPSLCEETGDDAEGSETSTESDTSGSGEDTGELDSATEDSATEDSGGDDTAMVDSATGDAIADSTSDTAASMDSGLVDSAKFDSTTVDSAVVDSAKVDTTVVDTTVVDTSAPDTAVVDTAPADTCVCVPGTVVPGTGTCANVLEKKTRTCAASCTWGPDVCALPKGWTAIAEPPASFEGRCYPASAWTGGELIVHGGARSIESSTPFGDGAMYRLSTNTWTVLPTTSAPSARMYSTGVWTGRDFVVWGGRSGTTYHSDGAAYDPTTKSWAALAASPLTGRNAHVAVWATTTKQMLVWGGVGAGAALSDGAAYDPSSATWAALPAAPINGRSGAHALWTGTEMLIWGGITSSGPATDGALYDPVKKTWRPIASSGVPGRYSPSAGLLGSDFVFFGGGTDTALLKDGRQLAMSTLGWSNVSVPSDALYMPRTAPAAFVVGTRMFVWSGATDDGAGGVNLEATGAVYEATTKTWSAMATADAPKGRLYAVTASMPNGGIVWGGLGKPSGGAIDIMHDGAIYVP